MHYKALGAADQQAPEWATGTAAIIQSLATPGVAAYSEYLRNDLDAERAKAGLRPTQNVSPKQETFTFGAIALIVIVIMLLMRK